MKVLLIADDENSIEKINSKLNENGFDTITYRWLLKSLDNVEEISPDVIIVSASSYPRHWKTLVQFVQTGFSGKVPKVILYLEKPLDDDDVKKSEALNIAGIIQNSDENCLDELIKIISDKQSKTYSLIFTNPKSGAFITGTILNYENDIISFEPDCPSQISVINEDQEITQATLKSNNSIKYISAKVISKTNNNSKIKLQVI